jgi:hypothetical protein
MTTTERGKILTGNRLTNGEVVFLSRAGIWSVSIDEAAVALDPQTQAAFEKMGRDAIATNAVTDAYLIDVERREGRIRALDIRERIRALGPSVRADLGKQAAGLGGAFAALS